MNAMFMDPFGLHNAASRHHQNAIAGMNNNNNRNQMMRRDDPFQPMMMSNPFSMMESMMGNMGRMFGNMVSSRLFKLKRKIIIKGDVEDKNNNQLSAILLLII
jgi:hypothetical protein